MSSNDRRAAARRRAWGRGPVILRFEPLEGRQLLAGSLIGGGPDLLATSFSTVPSAAWGDLIHATGTITNQGSTPTIAPSEVDIYASTSPTLGAAGSVGQLLGSAVVPAGLAVGASYSFDQIVDLPPSTIAGVASTQTLYITLHVDANDAVPEANQADKVGRGAGLDTSTLAITAHQPAALIGKSIGVTPTLESSPGTLSWGDSFNITEQIENNGQGNAPPTRARVVLTPAGSTPGGFNDVTIGDIEVPAIAAFQSTNIVGQIVLPKVEPTTLAGATQFTISIVQDADFLTQPIYPRVADQGAGLDQGPIGIAPGPNAGQPAAVLPDLAPASVVVSQGALAWGQQFQVGTVIQNVGAAASGPFRVRFVATGISGDVSHGIFLGDTTVTTGLAAGSSINVLSSVQLPAKLPYGTSLANPAYAQIYAIVDPEDVDDQSMRSNNMSSSAPVLLSVATADGSTPATVPTYPQNIYTVPGLAAAAAKKNAKAQAALGKPKPAASKPAKKHKVDLLASISESISKTVVKQIKAIPHGITSFLNDLGGSGSSSGGTAASTSTASTSTAATTTTTNTTSTPGLSGGGFGASGTGTSAVGGF